MRARSLDIVERIASIEVVATPAAFVAPSSQGLELVGNPARFNPAMISEGQRGYVGVRFPSNA